MASLYLSMKYVFICPYNECICFWVRYIKEQEKQSTTKQASGL